MENFKLTMKEAVLLEVLRSNGVSNKELIDNLESHSWEDLYSNEYQTLLNVYVQNKPQFKELLENGYSVKFITINGLKNLLKMKFEKIEDQDYKINNHTIELLELNPQQLSTLRQLLSINWVVEEYEREALDPASSIVKIYPIVVFQ
ncbi:hypothetical protein H9650_08395 [Psychrobacillus sp. Sa2BUA9]|uniref:Uncharacterized protein n=1 Tax=Psychrobacillus faecigallinarum TaxID=2762235 RepID=A0ABR8R8S1_9BACI|nr:hypothetical protein [Psychrobacillus faecigallinarum]MBD7944136.1 hypothetical protein [Psychrobacillus faecigallinarum]